MRKLAIIVLSKVTIKHTFNDNTRNATSPGNAKVTISAKSDNGQSAIPKPQYFPDKEYETLPITIAEGDTVTVKVKGEGNYDLNAEYQVYVNHPFLGFLEIPDITGQEWNLIFRNPSKKVGAKNSGFKVSGNVSIGDNRQ